MSAPVVREFVDLEQLVDRVFAHSAALVELVDHVGFQMVLDQQFVQGAEGLLDSEYLRDYVHAVFLVLNHLLEAAELAFEDSSSMKRAFLDVCNHPLRLSRFDVPLRGIERCNRDYSDAILSQISLKKRHSNAGLLVMLEIECELWACRMK